MNRKMVKMALAGLMLSVGGFANAGLINFDYSGPGLSDVDTSTTSEISFNIFDDLILEDLNVFINISGNFTGNNDIWIEHLSKTVQLFASAGTNDDALGSMQALFDDEASSLPSTNKVGTFQSVDLLSAFDGMTTNGTWTLRIADNTIFPGEGDDLITWSLRGTATEVPEPSTLAIFALGLMGLVSPRFRKQS